MADGHFERLSAMDLSFLAMEDGRAHMHIGSVSLYDALPLRTEGGGIDFDRVVSFTEAQLHKFPRLRQRLEWVPGFAQPGWVDDEHFNLAFHVRRTALPQPGDVRQLKRLAGRVLSQELDRAKPLWEYWFVEGVAGDRFAVIAKLHHCLADGLSGVAVGNLLVGSDPDYEPPPRRDWVPRPPPSGPRLVAGELRHRIAAPLGLLRTRRPEGGPQEPLAATRRGLLGLLGNAVRSGSPTPLNVQVGTHRRFDWTTIPFDDVHRIAGRAGGTVNDVALAIATGALRDFLRQRSAVAEDLDFRAVVPVNVRSGTERSSMGNRVSELIVHLPLAEAEPWKRLLAVIDATQELKASGQAGAGDLMGQAVDLLPAQLVGPLFRMASRSSVANMILTNVPGPRVPVYLLGARQLQTYPVVPLLANQAVGIALMSYDDHLCWGFNADWDAVPDLHDLVQHVEASFAELCAAVPGQESWTPAAED
jgi:diacylglycerol O-acyltransferase / wax synthase